MSKRIGEALKGADKILSGNISPLGMMASNVGYTQVWARDSVITLLGATVRQDETALACLKTSLNTLAKFQSRSGQIPSLVFCNDGTPSWGTMDPNPWFVIGAARYAALTGDQDFRTGIAAAVVRALDWCEAMDNYHYGLMISPEMGDWADLLANHGHVLFPNVLVASALEVGAAMLEPDRPAEAARFRQRQTQVVAAIQDYFWVKPPAFFDDRSHFQIRKIMACALRTRPFFLPWVDVSDYGDYFDTTGNLLAILCGVANDKQAEDILAYIDQMGVNRPYPVQVLYPPIQPGDRHWRDYYKIFNLNLPHQYHNGGIWPWVGGLYVAALVKAGQRARAAAELDLLAESCRLHKAGKPWEFNEWLQGRTGQPMGSPLQAWSAGMFLYADHAVRTGETAGFTVATSAPLRKAKSSR